VEDGPYGIPVACIDAEGTIVTVGQDPSGPGIRIDLAPRDPADEAALVIAITDKVIRRAHSAGLRPVTGQPGGQSRPPRLAANRRDPAVPCPGPRGPRLARLPLRDRRQAARPARKLATPRHHQPRPHPPLVAHAPFNIGIACGPSGLVVIDLDIPKNDGDTATTGMKSLTELCQRHGQPYPDDTFTVTTPSKGTHLYFQAPDGQLRNSAGHLGPLIDTHAVGGNVLAPRQPDRRAAVRGSRGLPPGPAPRLDHTTTVGAQGRDPGGLIR
jgi:hypothetical protein